MMLQKLIESKRAADMAFYDLLEDMVNHVEADIIVDGDTNIYQCFICRLLGSDTAKDVVNQLIACGDHWAHPHCIDETANTKESKIL